MGATAIELVSSTQVSRVVPSEWRG